MYSRSQEILRYIRDHGPTAAHTIWEHFGMSSYQETDACLKDLYHQNLLRFKAHNLEPYCTYSITVDGLAAIEEIDKQAAQQEQERREKEAAKAQHIIERADDRAREERHHKTQNRIAIYSPLIGSVVGYILGLLTDNFPQIWAFIIGLFH